MPTLRERLKYRFDNALSKGPLVLIGWLAVATITLVILATLLALMIPGFTPQGAGSKEVFWDFLFQALTPNPFDVTSPLPFLLIMLVVTLASLFIVSILIGTLTTAIDERLEHLRRGRSKVLENDHIVILGWSHQVFTIIKEIVAANENHKHGAVIAILADRDKVEMENNIRERVPHTKNTRIICRSGLPNDPTDIEIISPHSASSIIIMPPEDGDKDSYVIKTALALMNSPRRRVEPYHIVTEIQQPHNLDVVRLIGARDDLHTIQTGDIIARVTAQTSRQSGLSMVYTELLNFAGNEIYFKQEPSLSGRVFGDVLNAYEDSAVIGLQYNDGRIKLNPPMETRIAPGDKIIAISADDDTIKLGVLADPPVMTNLIHNATQREMPRPEKGLIIGWNDTAVSIMEDLDFYVAEGSTLTVLAGENWHSAVNQAVNLKNQKIIFRPGDTIVRAVLDELNVAEYDHVIVLADTTLDTQEADARTLITLLHLRNIAEKDETPFSIVSEMLDLRNRELAEVARVDDFIVSDHLISLLMAQISENGDLYALFADLFSPEGSEIYLNPADDYVESGQPVNFFTVVEAARQRSEVAVGYRLASEMRDGGRSYCVHTNPLKSSEIVFAHGDKVIVLAEK